MAGWRRRPFHKLELNCVIFVFFFLQSTGASLIFHVAYGFAATLKAHIHITGSLESVWKLARGVAAFVRTGMEYTPKRAGLRLDARVDGNFLFDTCSAWKPPDNLLLLLILILVSNFSCFFI